MFPDWSNRCTFLSSCVTSFQLCCAFLSCLFDPVPTFAALIPVSFTFCGWVKRFILAVLLVHFCYLNFHWLSIGSTSATNYNSWFGCRWLSLLVQSRPAAFLFFRICSMYDIDDMGKRHKKQCFKMSHFGNKKRDHFMVSFLCLDDVSQRYSLTFIVWNLFDVFHYYHFTDNGFNFTNAYGTEVRPT